MSITSASLLERLRQAVPTDPAWATLLQVYSPLLQATLTRLGVPPHDRDDCLQNIWQIVLRELPQFQRQREGSFRAWLRNVCRNQVRAFRRSRPHVTSEELLLDQLVDSDSLLARQFDADHDRALFTFLCRQIEQDFTPASWEQFRRHAIQGEPAASVAAACGTTP
ncbi:MAG: RNA polymerase sigma factor, partial [Gemmataceae bacterium]